MTTARRRLIFVLLALLVIAGASYGLIVSRISADVRADAAARRTPTSRPATTAPLELEPGPGRNLLQRPISLITRNENMVEGIAQAKRITMAAPVDCFERIIFAPRQSFARFDLRMRCYFAPEEPEKTAAFARLMTIGLFDREKPMPPDILDTGMPGGFLGLVLYADGGGRVAVVHGSGGAEVTNEPASGVSMDLSEAVVIRLLRDGGRDEVYLNDRKIFAAPSAAAGATPAMPGVYIKTVGARLNHTRLVMTEPPTAAGDVALAVPIQPAWR